MSDQMPERIYALPSITAGIKWGDWCCTEDQAKREATDGEDVTEYVRADLVREAKREVLKEYEALLLEEYYDGNTAHDFDNVVRRVAVEMQKELNDD